MLHRRRLVRSPLIREHGDPPNENYVQNIIPAWVRVMCCFRGEF